MPDYLLELENISKSYGPVHALQDVSVRLPYGCIGLLGPNGAGKSTLIKLMLGLLTLDKGRGKVLGYDIERQRLELRLRVGYMPENDCYLEDMNAVRFVSYMAELSGIPPIPAMQRAHEMLDFVGLDEARYRPIGTYSMGMKQRVKLAQAIVHDPQLVFLDEPTNGMDPKGRQDMLRLIQKLGKQVRMSFILCSHILPDVERTCEHVMILDKGTVKASASMAEIMASTEDEGYYLSVRGESEAQTAAFAGLLAAAGMVIAPLDGGRLRIHPRPDSAWWELVFRAAQQSRVQVRKLERKKNRLELMFLETLEIDTPDPMPRKAP